MDHVFNNTPAKSQKSKPLEPQYLSLLQRILSQLHCEEGESILSGFKDGSWGQRAASMAMPVPEHHSTADSFARSYLAYGLLRKSLYLPIKADLKGTCLQKWWQAELTCRKVNLNHGKDPDVETGPIEGSLEAVIFTAKAKIQNLLGEFSWDEANASFGFTGGASTRLPRKCGHPFYKFSGKPEVTRNAALLAVCAIWHSPSWRESMQTAYGLDPCNWVTVVEGSKFATVSKTALTDRPICIEPDMNMFLQSGIGAMIRTRLKRRAHIDLNDQSHNQRLAWIGSRTGSLCTIDLASASDSVSLELVKHLLPHDWFSALCRTRSEVVIFPDGKKHTLEKISSMGNGYTFELESLIFWALTAACLEVLEVPDKRLGIYGDDIVCHHSAADTLIRVLRRCGFETNKDKTFVSGPFRESCGKHYFYGADVTPFYVKEQSGRCLTDLYWLANMWKEWLSRHMPGPKNPVERHMIAAIRTRTRGALHRVPRSFGTRAGLISEWDEARPTWCKAKQMYRFAYWKAHKRNFRPNGLPSFHAWIHRKPETEETPPQRFDHSELVIPKGELSYRLNTTYVPVWQ